MRIIPLLLLVVACKKEVPPVAMDAPVAAPVAPAPAQDPVPTPTQQLVRNFERVHFDYDSATLDANTRKLLEENAQILLNYQDIYLEIQGHADERGTTEYNLALGQSRATAVSKYLLSLGVAPSRLKSVSYGEERPLDSAVGEVAWAQNRRAEFRILRGGGAVAGTTP